MKIKAKKKQKIRKIKTTSCDVENWLYSETVKDHFFKPRNILLDEANYVADGVGIVGSPACGDMMAVWIKQSSRRASDRCWFRRGIG